MRQYLGWAAIGWLLALGALAVAVYGRSTIPPSLDARAASLESGLRCLVCQGESIAQSRSGFAQSVRALVRRRLREGQPPDQIRAFLVSRYTDTILLAPPPSGLGGIAWFTPPLLVLGGFGLLATLVYDWRRRGREPAAVTRAAYRERVRAELAAERDR